MADRTVQFAGDGQTFQEHLLTAKIAKNYRKDRKASLHPGFLLASFAVVLRELCG
jgi:hypothetical protein